MRKLLLWLSKHLVVDKSTGNIGMAALEITIWCMILYPQECEARLLTLWVE